MLVIVRIKWMNLCKILITGPGINYKGKCYLFVDGWLVDFLYISNPLPMSL